VGAANGVAVATLAVDLGAGVFRDGVIAGDGDGTLRQEAVEDEDGQGSGEAPAVPAAAGEEAVEAGGVARDESAQGTEEVGDGTAACGEDGGEEEGAEAEEGRACKGRGEGVEELACGCWQLVMEVAESSSRVLGLAGLSLLEAAALGLGESLLQSAG
jgi:hypothetical protein